MISEDFLVRAAFVRQNPFLFFCNDHGGIVPTKCLMCSLNLYSLNTLFLIIEHHFDDKLDVLQHKWFRCRNRILVELLQSLPKSLSCQVGFCNNVFLPKYCSCVKFMILAQVHQPM